MKSIVLLLLSLLFVSIISLNVENRSEKYKGKEFVLDDVAFKLLPEITGCTFIAENTIPFMLIIILFFTKLLDSKFTTLISVIIFLRSIAIGLTVLPKTNLKCCIKCDLRLGVCHDKMFSGHTAFTTLSMLLIAEKYPHYKYLVGIVILLQGFMMLISRAHYSVDIYIGFLVSLLVYSNKTNILKVL